MTLQDTTVTDKKIETEDAQKAPDAAKVSDPSQQVRDGKQASHSDTDARSGSFFDDDDDGGDDTSVTETATDKAASEPDGKSDADWRAAFVERVTKGQEDKLTAAKLAKRKEGILNDLSRFKSVEDYMVAGFAAREKIRSGEYKQKLGDDATDEDKAAWRRENGIPDDPKGYALPKIQGKEWTDADKPLLDNFFPVAHEIGLNQQQADRLAEFVVRQGEAALRAQQDNAKHIDTSDRETTQDALMTEMGIPQYKANLNLVRRMLGDDDVMPKELADKLKTARTPDGRLVSNDPNMVRFLFNLAADRYGEGALITGDAAQKLSSREEEIKKIRATDINRYYKEGLDGELLEIARRKESQGKRPSRAA